MDFELYFKVEKKAIRLIYLIVFVQLAEVLILIFYTLCLVAEKKWENVGFLFFGTLKSKTEFEVEKFLFCRLKN